MYTLPKTDIAPENRPSQKESSLATPIFQGLCWFQGVFLFNYVQLQAI